MAEEEHVKRGNLNAGYGEHWNVSVATELALTKTSRKIQILQGYAETDCCESKIPYIGDICFPNMPLINLIVIPEVEIKPQLEVNIKPKLGQLIL